MAEFTVALPAGLAGASVRAWKVLANCQIVAAVKCLVLALVDIDANTGAVGRVSVSTDTVVIPVAISALFGNWITRVIIVDETFVDINAVARICIVFDIALQTMADSRI
jgi:hypothetical protein